MVLIDIILILFINVDIKSTSCISAVINSIISMLSDNVNVLFK